MTLTVTCDAKLCDAKEDVDQHQLLQGGRPDEWRTEFIGSRAVHLCPDHWNEIIEAQKAVLHSFFGVPPEGSG